MLEWIVASAAMSAAGTWLARRYALRRRLVDEPGERRSHAVATPRGGGIGPVLASAVVIAASGLRNGLPGADWRWLLAALLGVALIGAWDDHRPLGARIRLFVHVLAGIALASGFGLEARPLAMLGVVAAVAVLVNVWNFMDGIDGLASTQAVLVALTGAVLLAHPWAGAAFAVAAAIAAFVPFNFPRARVFLGDVGSGALGLLLAMLGVAMASTGSGEAHAALLLFPAAAFLVDASLTLAWRVAAGERWWTPHTRHLYQALARRHGHAKVTIAYGAWSAIGGAIAIALEPRAIALIIASLALWYTATAVVWACLQHRLTSRSAAR